MRIGIDARMYGPKQAGLGRYIQKLLENLVEIDSENEYVIFLKEDNFNLFETKNPKFKKVLADIHWYGKGEQLLFPKIIKKEGVDLMHFPHWNVPLFYRAPFVVTIHDLILLHYPNRRASTLNPVLYFLKYIFFRIILWHATNNSKKIITVSKFVKNDLIKTSKVKQEKIVVTYEASLEKIGGADKSVLEKYNITKPFVMYVGNAFPHKNLEMLVKSWKFFIEKYSKNYQLVLVGKENYFYKRLQKEVEKYNDKNLSESIKITGFVPDEELSQLYKKCGLYVFPSLYEGFGIPPLEAMQYGVPVVSSDRSCMPEILEDAANYFDPENYQEMAKVIYKNLTNKEERKKLQENSKRVLKKYSWKKMVEETIEIYK
ncbi:MAG: glycosyltransferase family 4 protein [Candidatus Magasanikbacteria bacterium]|nr:glycosyltransferase family 4 protein [Candidatus Magasanikbacteria bacterium]